MRGELYRVRRLRRRAVKRLAATTTSSTRRRARAPTRWSRSHARVARAADVPAPVGSPGATTPRRARRSPTTAASGAAAGATSSTRWTSTASRSPRRADLRLRLETERRVRLRLITASRPAARQRRRQRRARPPAPSRALLRRRAGAGRRGAATLSRLARTITRARMTVDGGRRPVAPGETADLALRVTPRGDRPRHARRGALRPDRGLALPRPTTRAWPARRRPSPSGRRSSGAGGASGRLRRHAEVEPEQRRHGAVRRPRALEG